ncbi:MAG: metallophosphatase family protein [Actinobacteria bacterium]|nr:metallophosphatase family protein [Actinomycetota bacterium]MBU1942111.1 metallophosphatase family protein [Actinomycetota bacterium]MBU2686705.1 metallophosphatase family protein [Actinomycetota bacterium]
MLIGVISDTHLKDTALPDRVLEALAGSDLILHAGDILDLAVLEQLSKVAETVAVRGNMDHAEVARTLPEKRVIEAAGFRIGLTHGYGAPTSMTRKVAAMFDDVQCVVFGHTHHPLIKERGGVLFVNPGSPTDRMFARRHTVGFLDLDETITARILDI